LSPDQIQHLQPIRVAVLDLSLGGPDHRNQDGLKVLDLVRGQDPGCVSIILTGFATVELAVSVIQDKGAFTCLRKETFRRSDFRKVIQQALASVRNASGPGAELEKQGEQPKGHSSSIDNRNSGAAFLMDQALVVEDDAGWRSLLSELLTDAGYHPNQCVSFVEALGMLRSDPYRLAVIDLSLASSLEPATNQDGFRLLATTQKAGIPTIIVSGYADPADIERAYEEFQLFACLEKQAFDRKIFLDKVNKARQWTAVGSELQNLTGREREVLELLARGFTNKEIGTALFITPNTVKRHLKALFAKLGVNTRAAASSIASRAGLGK
jgi:DNA-binding NarL/FixJ family response regulator